MASPRYSSFLTQVFLFIYIMLNESNVNLQTKLFCNIDKLNSQIGLKVLFWFLSQFPLHIHT